MFHCRPVFCGYTITYTDLGVLNRTPFAILPLAAKPNRLTLKGCESPSPARLTTRGRTACVYATFTLFTPDVFAKDLPKFEHDILERYADTSIAGACKDEWGFPGRFNPRTDDLYFSRSMAKVYAKRRPGHDLVRDMLLMAKKEKGQSKETAAAINHYMEMNWQRNAEVENAY